MVNERYLAQHLAQEDKGKHKIPKLSLQKFCLCFKVGRVTTNEQIAENILESHSMKAEQSETITTHAQGKGTMISIRGD